YQPFEKLDALLTYVHQDTRSGGRQVTSTPILGTGPYESAVHVPDRVHRSVDLTSLELTAELGFAELVSSSSWAETQFDFVRDQTDQLLEFQYGYEQFPQFVAYAVGEAPNQAIPRQQFVQELRLVSSDGGPFKWIAGGYYSRGKNFATYSEYTPGFPAFAGIPSTNELEYQAIGRSKVNEQAGFGEIGYNFTDAWQVTVGGRYFSYSADTTQSTELPFFDLLSVLPNVSTDQNGSLFKFNTSYQFTPDLMMYATVSEGYRRGGVNGVPPCIGGVFQPVCGNPREQIFRPDETRNHELGLRSTWLDKRLTLNAAVYYVKWRDVQVQTTTTIGGQQITGNGAKATSEGIELQIQALLPAGFSLMGS
ncbi:MAG: TonB-dependent receptor domain-containing protein, partial [Steroidobacteraceae bacterium]